MKFALMYLFDKNPVPDKITGKYKEIRSCSLFNSIINSCSTFVFTLSLIFLMSNSVLQSSNFDSEFNEINKSVDGEKKIDAINALIRTNLSIHPRKSIDLLAQNLQKSLDMKYNKGIAESYHNLGNAYFFINYHDESDSLLKLALTYYQQINDYNSIIKANLDRGNTLKDIKKYDEAIEVLNSALELSKKNSKDQIPYIYQELGSVYTLTDNIQKAIENLNASLDIFIKDKNTFMIPFIRTDLANAYLNSPNPDDAMPHLTKAREEFNKQNNRLYMAKTFKMEGDINKIHGNLEDAAQLYLKAYDLYIFTKETNGQKEVLQQLYELESGRNNPEKAFEYLEKYTKVLEIQLDLNLLRKETEKQITIERIQKQIAQNRFGVKDSELSKMKDIAEIQRLTSEKKSAWITFFVIMSLLLIALAFILFYLFKNKKKNNEILKKINLELAAKNKLIDNQKSELEIKNKHILDSIEYAKRIQKAILPIENMGKSMFSDFFVLFMPKDIVSGDFYWFAETSEYRFVAVVDCTGHGVPGAFMSMIGNTMLNDIVTGRHISEPKDILTTLNSKIRLALKQDYDVGANDGMDMALIRLNKNNTELIFAGAKRPMYIVHNEELTEYKGDKLSIGGSINEVVEDFTQTNIKFERKSYIYITTDGYADQNNHDNKKIGSKNLKELLIKISSKKGNEQAEILRNKFIKFSAGETQRDDVAILGIRID